MKKTIYGVGTNDANYLVVNKGVRCPYYKKWSSMLERCFSKSLHKKHPTYIGWYENIADAKKAYAARKAALINELAKINSDHRVKAGLLKHAKSLLQ